MTDQVTDTTEATEDALASSTSDASLRRSTERSRAIEEQIAKDPSGFRMLTGDRPTGHLHIGHYFGSLMNRVRLQDAGVDTFVLVADYQVISDRDGTGPIRERVQSLVTDYLAIGIDPAKTTIFAHSQVPALNQLMLPFLSLVSDSSSTATRPSRPNTTPRVVAPCRGSCSPTPSTRPPTSCSARRTSCPSARTSCRISSRPASSLAASTSVTAASTRPPPSSRRRRPCCRRGRSSSAPTAPR